jgi:hypothetical protein
LTRKICKIGGCRARAWQRDLCNLHALEQYRSPQRHAPRSERLAEGKKMLRERARELGIALANDPEAARASARAEAAPKYAPEYARVGARSGFAKVRSPVG